MLLIGKHRTSKIVFFCLIGLAFVSCKSYYTTLTIENAHPAKEELPSEIQSLTLMNRSMNNQFENYQEDSLQLYFYRQGFQLSKIRIFLLCFRTKPTFSFLKAAAIQHFIVQSNAKNME